MFRYIVPIILIGTAVTGFLMFTKPTLDNITNIQNEITSYNEALDNSKSLESERDKLTTKYNAIDPNDLARLQKFLPDNVDNIRLILEIEKLALPYGMVLKDVKYDATLLETKDSTASATPASVPSNSISDTTTASDRNNQYGTWNLEFSTEGRYSDFISFTKDLENNLRMVDIASVIFSSDGGVSLGKTKTSDLYKYDFKIKTYWLKN